MICRPTFESTARAALRTIASAADRRRELPPPNTPPSTSPNTEPVDDLAIARGWAMRRLGSVGGGAYGKIFQ
jgi:hypothetical protein